MTIWKCLGPFLEPITSLLHPSRYHVSCTASDQLMLIQIHVWNTETQVGMLTTIRASEQPMCFESPGEAEAFGGVLARNFKEALYAPRQLKGNV